MHASLRRKQEHYTSINTKNAGSYYTDVFSMIGTLALWWVFPSLVFFNLSRLFRCRLAIARMLPLIRSQAICHVSAPQLLPILPQLFALDPSAAASFWTVVPGRLLRP